MRPILAISVVSLAVTLSALSPSEGATPVGPTIDRGLTFLARDAMAWKEEHNCVSCHHAGLGGLVDARGQAERTRRRRAGPG